MPARFRGSIPASRADSRARPLDPFPSTRSASTRPVALLRKEPACPPPTSSTRTPPPARIGTVRALWRLREYVGPALPFIVGSMAAYLVAQLIALAIPQVLEAIVDGPLADGDRERDRAAVAARARARRGRGRDDRAAPLARAHAGTRVEARMRNALYAKLQDLPVSFHDRWPSGQLLSRAVSDLGLIRRWLAFGLVLLVVNLVVIVVGVGDPHLDELDARPRVPRLLGAAVDRRLPVRGPLLRGVATQPGPVGRPRHRGRGVGARHPRAEGVRARQARAESTSVRRPSAAQRPRSRRRASTRTSGSGSSSCPTVALAICLVLGVVARVAGQLTVGELVAFFATAAVLAWPIESIGFLLAFSLDARTATDRFFDILDSENTITDPERPVAIERPRGELAFDDVHFRYQDSPERFARPARRRRPRAASRARPWRSSASPARARRR